MHWSNDHQQMQWWVDGLRPFTDHVVGSIVPHGFEAIARLFHPIELGDGLTEPWSAVAARTGRVVHPEMQLHAIGTPLDQPVERNWNDDLGAWLGDLPQTEAQVLVELLSSHTSTPTDCWFGVWEGYGSLALPRWKAAGPHSRPHYLLEGALADMPQAWSILGQSPNLWWPTDRSWFVASEIDFCWTLIGGTQALVDDLIANPNVEVLQSGYDHRGTIDADRINV